MEDYCLRRQPLATMGSRRLCYGEAHSALRTTTGFLEVSKLQPWRIQSCIALPALDLQPLHMTMLELLGLSSLNSTSICKSGAVQFSLQTDVQLYRCAYAAWHTHIGKYMIYSRRTILAWRNIERWTEKHHPIIAQSLG